MKKGLNSARTLPPFNLGVVQRCVCLQKCEQTFVIITCHFHPGPLKKSEGGGVTHKLGFKNVSRIQNNGFNCLKAAGLPSSLTSPVHGGSVMRVQRGPRSQEQYKKPIQVRLCARGPQRPNICRWVRGSCEGSTLHLK